MTNEEQEYTFDKFELIAAIVLGLAAIGTALASFQSGLWGGKSVEAYGKANKEATKAASECGKSKKIEVRNNYFQSFFITFTFQLSTH